MSDLQDTSMKCEDCNDFGKQTVHFDSLLGPGGYVVWCPACGGTGWLSVTEDEDE